MIVMRTLLLIRKLVKKTVKKMQKQEKVRCEKEWNRVQHQTLRNQGKEYADRKEKVH
jgi:hypothetical protein